MENMNFPPVEFSRPDSGCSATGRPTNANIFQEFAIVMCNILHFESMPTTRWLDVLKGKAIMRQKRNQREADRLMNVSVQLAENDELEKSMINVTQALFRCPADSVLAKAILCQKGELLRRMDRLQDAIRHLEHCLEIEGERFSFGTYLCLLRCHKAMGNARKVRTTLTRCSQFFTRWKDEFQRYDSQLQSRPDAHMEEMKKEFDLHANCIPLEISNDKSFRNEPAVQDNYEEVIELKPFRGFTKDKKIAGASEVCRVEFDKKGSKLVATASIPEGAPVLLERPLASHLEFSKVQCYTCHVVNPHLIPCFYCQAVFYCSYPCQQEDLGYHVYECKGYKLLYFPLVNGNLELRMLIRTLNALNQIAAVQQKNTDEGAKKGTPKPTSPPRTADELFRLMMNSGSIIEEGVMNILSVRLDYSRFRQEDFNALMIKTEKLLSYVKYDGKVKQTFFTNQLWKHLEGYQFDMFIGGLLLHFNTLTMTKVSRLSYNILATEEFVGRIQEGCTGRTDRFKNEGSEPLKKTILDTLERYGNASARRRRIDTDLLREGALQYLDKAARKHNKGGGTDEEDAQKGHQVWTRANVRKLWQQCLDSIPFQASSTNGLTNHYRPCDEELVTEALIRFCDCYFDYFGEIPVCSRDRTFPNCLRAFYPTAMKLKHSCAPNLFSVMISNGLLVARARQDIKIGEELTLNHGPHYKEAPRYQRRAYLSKIYIDCDCVQCDRSDDLWMRYRRVKCRDCLFKTNGPESCAQCVVGKKLPMERELLIQQLQNIESNLARNHLPQLLPLAALGRAGSGLQTVTASGKRKIELLLFFERVWLMLFLEKNSVPLYNNLKEQLSCFAEDVIRDTIDGVLKLLIRCKETIDILFPAMSVELANEYELVVRRVVKYMLPAKFLGVDLREVTHTIELARGMIRTAFTILEAHCLTEDESYRNLVVVKDSLRTFKENLRITTARDESDLLLTMLGNVMMREEQCKEEEQDPSLPLLTEELPLECARRTSPSAESATTKSSSPSGKVLGVEKSNDVSLPEVKAAAPLSVVSEMQKRKKTLTAASILQQQKQQLQQEQEQKEQQHEQCYGNAGDHSTASSSRSSSSSSNSSSGRSSSATGDAGVQSVVIISEADEHDERERKKQQALMQQLEGGRTEDGGKTNANKNTTKRRDTGAIPKPARTTKHHRKV